MARVYRFAEYRRAMWLAEINGLEAFIRDAWTSLPNKNDRIVERLDGASVMGLNQTDFGTIGFAIHCVKYVSQQPVGVVPMDVQATNKLGHRLPGNAENFLENDFFAVISGDHVVTLGAGQNAASLRLFLAGLFNIVGLGEEAAKFDLVRVADANKLQMIAAAGGVKKIDMSMTLQEATARLIEERQPRSTAEKLTKPIRDVLRLFQNNSDGSEGISRSKKGNMHLSVSVPGGDVVAAKGAIDAMASGLILDEDAENFMIELRSGEVIRAGEVSLKRKISLERYANTVNADQVLPALAEYMEELKRSRQTET